MNKKITASLCAILILLAGCSKKVDPDLEVAPENPAPSAQQTTSERVDAAEAERNKPAEEQPKPVEVRKQVDVLATQNPCWVKVDKLWLNITSYKRIQALHSIEQYGVLLEAQEVFQESTHVFIPTDKPEEVIDAMMTQTQTCGKQT
jgi:hypothetical protein